MRLTSSLLLGVLLCLAPAASHAFDIPLPTKDATLNLQLYIQPRFQVTEDGATTGRDPAFDMFMRRSRVQINGDIGKNFLYLVMVDNPNYGRFGSFTSRVIVQDAWFSWGPTGTKGDNVFLLEGGILFIPSSRFTIMSSANKPSIDGHPDLVRGFNPGQYLADRTTGAQFRGWALHKKIGFRGGVYEGVQPSSGPGLNPKRYPAVALFMNFDLIGSEEGGWLYQGILFGKEPVLSLSVAGTYQSQALRTLKGVTDQRSLTSTLFLDVPLPWDQELAVTLGGYLFGNGTGSKDTGVAASVDFAYRVRFVKPYVSLEYFNSDDCTPSPGNISAAQCAQAHTADSRNFRAGMAFYINKAQQHLDVEFALNRGQSTVGPQSLTPPPPVGPGEQPFTSLGRRAGKTLVMQWTMIF